MFLKTEEFTVALSVASWSKLTSLDLDIGSMQRSHFMSIAKFCPNLATLSMYGSGQNELENQDKMLALETIVSSCKNLGYLSVDWNSHENTKIAENKFENFTVTTDYYYLVMQRKGDSFNF